MNSLKAILNRIAVGECLSRSEARALFDDMVSGEATGPQIGALLMGLRQRGETIAEIVGAAEAMRTKMRRVSAPESAVDIVGTGGDGHGTYNISTTAAFIVAGAGVPVAKHGNRAVSSKSGAADVLTALGLHLEQTPEGVERCLSASGLGFMFAPAHHPALKAVMPARLDLGMRTIFNVLGPLLNPASVRHHLIGVYSDGLVRPIAEALRHLGSSTALVVHGADGLDELSTTTQTKIAMLRDGEIAEYTITPEDVGLPRATLEQLRGGDGPTNAAALRAVLKGEDGPYRNISLFNAAGALIAAGAARDWPDGLELARAAVDSGRARHALTQMVQASQPVTASA